MAYLILCKERVQGMALWWRSDRRGYTTDLLQAGRYSKEDAASIQRIRGTDFPVPEEAIGSALTPRRVVMLEDGDNVDALRMYQEQPMLDAPRPTQETAVAPRTCSWERRGDHFNCHACGSMSKTTQGRDEIIADCQRRPTANRRESR